MLDRRKLFGVTALAGICGIVGCTSDDGKPSGSSGTTNTSSGGDPPEDAGSPATDAALESSTAKKKNGELGCTGDADCESNVCYQGDKQSYCSLRCTTENAATVCATPFSGSCNNKGFCKRGV
jgi:hypothetical protein